MNRAVGTQRLNGENAGTGTDLPLLFVLALAHGFNDFCVGVTAPMIPAMEAKYGLGLGGVTGIVITMGLVGNYSQPIAGWFLDRARTVRVLLVTPIVVGGSLLVGFTDEPWQARTTFFFAGLAMGTFHPYAFILARSTLPGRPALATSIFISFGFLGVSTGSLVSGTWMERWAFDSFHLLYAGAIVIVCIFLVKGLHRIDLEPYRKLARPPEVAEKGDGDEDAKVAPIAPTIPFGILFTLALLMAVENGAFFFFLPKLFEILFGSEGLGGRAVFMMGLGGGLISYLYGFLSDRGNVYRVAMWTQVVGLLPLLGFFYFDTAAMKMAMAVGIGLTLGGSFPALVSMAPGARGLTLGLRSALMFGGVWGTSNVCSLIMARIAEGGLELETVMSIVRIIPFILVPIFWYASKRYVAD